MIYHAIPAMLVHWLITKLKTLMKKVKAARFSFGQAMQFFFVLLRLLMMEKLKKLCP